MLHNGKKTPLVCFHFHNDLVKVKCGKYGKVDQKLENEIFICKDSVIKSRVT